MLKWHIERSRRLLSVMACLVVVLAGLSACAQGTTSGNTYAQPNNPVTIGVSISNKTDKQGDDFRSDSAATLQGYELWRDMINSTGGLLGRPVKLDVRYDDSDPTVVAANYDALITKDHVNLVFAPFSSLLTKAATPEALKNNYVMVEASGGAPSVFANHWPNLFDVTVPVTNNLITFAYYILSLPPKDRPKTAAYLSSDDPFTFPQIEKARTLLENAGVRTLYPTGAKVNMPPDTDTKLLNALPSGYEQFNEGDAKTAAEDAALVAHTHADVAILGTLLPDIKAEVPVFKQWNYNPKALVATAGPDAGQDFINTVGGVHYTEGFFCAKWLVSTGQHLSEC